MVISHVLEVHGVRGRFFEVEVEVGAVEEGRGAGEG